MRHTDPEEWVAVRMTDAPGHRKCRQPPPPRGQRLPDEVVRVTHSQRVANEKPTAMKAMPTIRFHWPRSLKTGRAERSSEKT